ncbi:bestrophin family protein [Cellvibrio sp. OA-2007]|uniref:bestrophin family protein n=1 Tax=Cellvibrio sp. OA-2007 TaxID=529823 RepID=UPI00078202BB|nr:bestrophin family ion channel [Cellvibrio sp. OA-2007]
MIIRPKLHWFRMLFVWRGSLLSRILPRLFTLVVLATIVVFVRQDYPHLLPDLTPIPFTLLGIALAIFLSFRNSVSYDRFWEARKLWGGVLNETRALTREQLTAADASDEQNRQFVYTLIAFVHALRAQLRETDATPALQKLLRPEVQETVIQGRFKPELVILDAAQQLRTMRKQEQLCPILFARMDQHLSQLSACLGGCERIASTPVPFGYSVILHRTVYSYCFLLPLGLAATLGFMTPVIIAFVAYTFLALEALAEELQDPFGTEPNDLALDAMTHTIESSLREMLGEPIDPPPAVPDNCVVT